MSLVGTRPILQDELQKYELHHRARIAIKPGITGMWQVSGRSDITDFEEVVRLDTEYISNWNFGLDIKILFKTVIPYGLLRCIRSQIQSGRQQMRHWNFMRLSQEGKSLTELHGLQLPVSLSAPDLMRRIRMLL